MIGDGVLLFNVGCGYVICWFLWCLVVVGKKLGIDELFLVKMVFIVGEIMKDYYLDVLENVDYIVLVIFFEEDCFFVILNGGLSLLNSVIDEVK